MDFEVSYTIHTCQPELGLYGLKLRLFHTGADVITCPNYTVFRVLLSDAVHYPASLHATTSATFSPASTALSESITPHAPSLPIFTINMLAAFVASFSNFFRCCWRKINQSMRRGKSTRRRCWATCTSVRSGPSKPTMSHYPQQRSRAPAWISSSRNTRE